MNITKEAGELRELILKKEKEGKVVIATFEGFEEIDIDEIIKQPTEGLLYDLNRDKVTCITWINQGKETWVNNYAVALIISKLKEYYDKAQL